MSDEFDAVTAELKDRAQWLMWDASADTPRRPHWCGDFNISWTNPDDWHTFEEAVEAAQERDSWGIGYVFAGGLDEYPRGVYGGLDLDGCVVERGTPKDWLPSLAPFIDRDVYMEYSPSVDEPDSDGGIHIPIVGLELPGWWSDCGVAEHEGVEAYEKKFFTFTGDTLDEYECIAEMGEWVTEWLKTTYERIEGSRPWESDTGSSDDREVSAPSSTGNARDIAREVDNLDAREVAGKTIVSEWNDGVGSGDNRAFYPTWGESDCSGTANIVDRDGWTDTGNFTGSGGPLEMAAIDMGELDNKGCEWGDADGKLWWDAVDHLRELGFNIPEEKATDGGSESETADNSSGTGQNPSSVIGKFAAACNLYSIDTGQIGTETQDDEKKVVGLASVVQTGENSDIGDAILTFNRGSVLLDGTDRQAVVGRVVLLDLQENGEFFQTPDGRLYYFHEPELEVYRIDGSGNRTFAEDFQAMVWDRYKLFAGQFSRNLGDDLKSQATRHAPTREVFQFAHYDETAGELYVSDWDSGYYAISPGDIEWRPNGTDVFFLADDYADGYQYLEEPDRPSLPEQLPGEQSTWLGSGDPLMRLFGNRINYDESTALAPADQRKQLYLHLHTLPFIDLLNARPIMAWVGEKGSGKTVVERSIGRFIYGSEFTESIMPDGKDDFLAKVTNQALAFVDNYDDGEEWANDVLAAIATGAGLDQRELYTTNDLRREVPRCWLSITSRDPPFRRDDVADRTLVFRVERVEEDFVGMGNFLRQVSDFRDLLWSTYIDNLQSVLREHSERDTDAMSSSHRMADWAIFAQIVADALDVHDVGELLDGMETERATFALENERWAALLDDWIDDQPADAATWRSASSLSERLGDVAGKYDRTFSMGSRGIGSKLSHYETELSELYGLEIDDSGRTNEYRFDVGDDATHSGLDRF